MKQIFEEIGKKIETKEGDSVDRIKDIIKKIGEDIIKFFQQEIDSLDLSERT